MLMLGGRIRIFEQATVVFPNEVPHQWVNCKCGRRFKMINLNEAGPSKLSERIGLWRLPLTPEISQGPNTNINGGA